jgi:hypothetical protein
MLYFARKLFGALMLGVTILLFLIRNGLYFIGATTVVEDAEGIPGKLQTMMEFLTAQHTIAFYVALTVLAAIGIGLLLPESLWANDAPENVASRSDVARPRPDTPAIDGLVLIQDAARRCFEETGLFSDQSIGGDLRLYQFVVYLVMEGHERPDLLQVWGIQVPATRKSRIPPERLVPGDLRLGGTELHTRITPYREDTDWKQLSILEYHIPAFIERLKGGQTAGQRYAGIHPATRRREADFDDFLPDFSVWDQKPAFTLAEAAYLWDDREPKPVHKMDDGAKTVFAFLRDAVEAGNLRATFTIDEALNAAFDEHDVVKHDERAVTVNTRVGRDRLREFAKSQGLRPMFLFVDARGV